MKPVRDAGADAEEEARARRQTQLEQRHLEAYRNLHRLRDALYRRYAALLKDKVQSQRLRLQQRHEAAVRKTEGDAKQKPKKLSFSKLQHNDSYLKSLPQTRYHLVLDLQTQLAEQGHLKTHHDLEEFYRCIKYNDHPSELQRSLQDVRTSMLGTKTPEKAPCTGEERGHTGDVSQSRLLEQRTGSGEQPAANGRQQINEFEQIFPKVKAPTFATLRPNFMENFRSRMPDLVPPELPERSRRAEVYVGRLRQMHHLSLINMGFSQRLLEQDSDAPPCREDGGGARGPVSNTRQPQHDTTVRRSAEACCEGFFTPWQQVLPHIDSKQKQGGGIVHSRVSPPKQPRSVRSHRGSRPDQPNGGTSSSQRHFEAVALAPAACGCKTPDPLCMEDVCQQKHAVVIDCGVKLWRNYT
ncbi:uncharacterized protein si:ch211-130h14.4 isoform X2 [Betta splendens]|uniref:Uncharacterized protein si:ch211-130h14.4 isoform X2 n=1 Tax=Betta splendens TaxID=158456 RepID=A0A9W2X9M3_BETSP|nr:uncharacterized protein si:ch211-130h14.4 isoform X2 [Betta splendens]